MQSIVQEVAFYVSYLYFLSSIFIMQWLDVFVADLAVCPGILFGSNLP